jgi:hypothetical protein
MTKIPREDWSKLFAPLRSLEPPATMRLGLVGPSGPGTTDHRTPPPWLRIVMVAATLSLVAGALWSQVGRSGSSLQGTSSVAGVNTSVPIGGNALASVGVCGTGDGKETTLTQLEASAIFTVLVPHDPAADTSTLAHTWQCPGTEVVLQFASGAKVYLNANGISDPAAAWDAMAKQSPNDTSVGTVLGQPAVFIEPAKSPGGRALGSVTFVDDGTWVVVEGNGKLSLDDLTRIAGSIGVP